MTPNPHRFSIADPVTGEIVQMLEKREIAHANTRAAVDLMTHLGVVMQEIVDQLDEDTILNMTPGPGSADDLRRIRDRLAGALRDDQAVRAAFLEHFPHLCREPDRPAGFPQPSSKDAGERSDAAAEKRGDFRHEEPGVDFAELDKTRAQEAKARGRVEDGDSIVDVIRKGFDAVSESPGFCGVAWGKHSCYLDKQHTGEHVCGFCVEGHEHPKDPDA